MNSALKDLGEASTGFDRLSLRAPLLSPQRCPAGDGLRL